MIVRKVFNALIEEIRENECDAMAAFAILALVGIVVVNCFKGF